MTEMKKYFVYVHTCPNEKKYVGVTGRDPESRWGKNGENYQYNKHFYSAIQKYGWSSIKHEVWELTCESEMYYAEKYLIAYYNTTDKRFGYNHSVGGEKSSLGCIRSEEFRRKHSESLKGRTLSEETRKKISEALKGKPHKPVSEETRKKISEAAKERNLDPEYKKKISEANRKSHLDPEVRKKMSEAKKGKTLSEEHRKHVAEANLKKWSDPEFRKKMSEAQKGKHHKPHSEETKKRISETLKGKPHKPVSEETRKKISESHKGKSKPRVKIKLPDGTIVEMTKNNITQHYVNKGKKFEYVS